jgi:SepF-like predicted cell division protein (DUF552 family)
MKKFLSKLKQTFTSGDDSSELSGHEEEYVELDTSVSEDIKSKVIVRPFAIEDFADIKPILDALRTGYTIALVNIKPLKEKDMVELKRAISKLKKTTQAIDGDIAGFSDDYIVIVPSFAEIYRGGKASTEVEDATEETEEEK